MRTVALIAGLITLMVSGAFAADWQWPAQMDLGGFRVTNIRGSVGADGAGSATGTLQIPGMGNASINLARSSRGDITGSASVDTRPLRGSFNLSESGLRGRGSIDCQPRSIDSPAIAVNSRGEATGSGRMSLGRLSASVDFTVSGSSCNVNGSVPVRAQIDTAVATYKFDGRLELQGGGNRVTGSVSGRIERTGKLANQTSSFNVPSTSVDLSNGQCTVNVGGVSVTFSLF